MKQASLFQQFWIEDQRQVDHSHENLWALSGVRQRYCVHEPNLQVLNLFRKCEFIDGGISLVEVEKPWSHSLMTLLSSTYWKSSVMRAKNSFLERYTRDWIHHHWVDGVVWLDKSPNWTIGISRMKNSRICFRKSVKCTSRPAEDRFEITNRKRFHLKH